MGSIEELHNDKRNLGGAGAMNWQGVIQCQQPRSMEFGRGVKLPLPLSDDSSRELGSGSVALTDGAPPGAAMVERLCARIDKLRSDAQEALTPSRPATPVLTPRGALDEGSASECGSASLRASLRGGVPIHDSTSWTRGALHTGFAPASREVSPGLVTRETLAAVDARD